MLGVRYWAMKNRTLHLLFVTLFIAQALIAQESQPSTESALVPPAIAAAKRVFISNAGADDDSGKMFSTGPDHCYAEFYRQVQALKRYEIVSSPLEADLVLEINMTASPLRFATAVVRVRILDPKTHVVLWAFYERPAAANLAHTYGKNLDKAITRLVSNLKLLTEMPSRAP